MPLIETRTIENGVSAKIHVMEDGKYLVAIFGTMAIPMAASRIFEHEPVNSAWPKINTFIMRAFNVSRMFPHPDDEDNRATNLRVLEQEK